MGDVTGPEGWYGTTVPPVEPAGDVGADVRLRPLAVSPPFGRSSRAVSAPFLATLRNPGQRLLGRRSHHPDEREQHIGVLRIDHKAAPAEHLGHVNANASRGDLADILNAGGARRGQVLRDLRAVRKSAACFYGKKACRSPRKPLPYQRFIP